MSPLQIALIAAAGLIVFLAVISYNRLVSKRNKVDNAWAQIDVQLKRRYDLIPNVVETVRGYASHERATLDAVTQARANALSAQTPGARAEAENMLTGALKSLFAVSEAYPDLKASERFGQLQDELATTENRIAYSRQYYNDSVLTYNTAIASVPSNFVAGVFRFTSREYFEAPDEERGPVQVRF